MSKQKQPQFPKIKYNQISRNLYSSEFGGDAPSGGSRKCIPPHILRKMAHESSEGGKAFCECCHTYFAMYYIRTVKLSTFRMGFACVDCIKEKHLQKIK